MPVTHEVASSSLVAPAIRTKKSAFTALFFVLNHRMIRLERATEYEVAPEENKQPQNVVC